MRKFIKFISISVALFLTIFSVANAQGVGSNSWFLSGGNLRPNVSTWGLLIPQLGGSGTSCVQVDNNGLFSVTGLACGSGGGGGSGGGTWATTTSLVAGRLINYPLNTTDIVVVGGVATSSATEYYFDPNTNTARLGNTNTASTTLMGNVFLPTVGQGFFYGGTNGLLQAISSSTLAGQVFPFTSVTGYNSTSTALGFLNGFFSTASSTQSGNFFLPALSQGFLYTGSNGLVKTVASSSINLSSLNNDLAALTATDASLTFSGSYNGSTARTVGLNLGNSNTWTVLQNFNYSSSTVYSSFLTSSSTNLFAGFLTLSTSTAGCLNTNTSGVVYAATCSSGGLSSYDAFTHPASGISATTSQLNMVGFLSTASSTIAGNSTTTGVAFATTASTTAFFGANISTCDPTTGKITWSGGQFGCGSDQSGAGGGTFPFTSQVGYNSTSTVIGFNGLFSTASSTFSGAFRLPAVAPSDLLAVDSTGLFIGTSTPTFGWYNATTSTATSTNAGPLQIGATAGDNALKIDCTGRTYPASVTTGGCLNVNGQVTIASTTARTLNRLFVINDSSTASTQDGAIASTSADVTTFNFKGAPLTKGVIKCEHTGNPTDANSNASCISIDLLNSGNTQGIFMDASLASTTGKLLNIRNKGTEELTFTATGLLGLASTSPFATLSVNPVQGLASAQFTVGSSSATNLIVANNGNVGIATATPMSVLSVVGSEDHWGNTYHFGPVATTDFFCMKGTQCLNYAGNDNTTNGSSIEVTNINAGAHAYAFLGVGNDLFSSAGWAYAGLATNSSGYNDTGFGALFNIPNLTSLQTNLGPIGIASATSTNSFIQFATGGNDTSNERMRIINTGQIGIGTTTPFAQLDIASTTASATFKPQLALTDSSAGANLKHWTLASEGGQFYLSTSSDVYATSTASAFAVTSNGTTTVSALNILGNGNGTTTSAVGFKITSGCYAIGSTCIGSGSGSGTVNTGIAGELAWYAANGTTLSPTTTDGRLTTGAFQATSTALTNLFMNAFTGFGSTTPMAQVQIATTSANAGFRPQLVLTDANASANSKHFYVDSMSGIFDIGTTSDTGSYATASAMTISAPTTASPNTVMGVGSTTPYATLSVGDTAGQDSFAIGSSTNYFKVSKTGSVFAPNTTTSGSNQTGYWCYDSNGQFIRDTTVCLVSALKFKKDITPLNQGLSDVLKMKPVNYYLKTPLGKEDAGEQIGFVADWAESVVPDLVTHDSNGDVHGFNYEQYTAVLTKAIQELNAKIGSGKRGMEENWQNILIGLLIAGFLYQQWQIKKLKK